MTRVRNLLPAGTMLLATTVLAGCLGGSGGGGAGGNNPTTPTTPTNPGPPTTVSAYQAEVDAHTARIRSYGFLGTPPTILPTDDMPITGTANYRGGVELALRRNEDVIGSLMGDLALAVDFGAANADQTRGLTSATVSNIRGQIGDELVTSDATLTKRGEIGDTSTVTIIKAGGGVVAGHTIPETRRGILVARVSGDLEVGDVSGPVELQLAAGQFSGPQAASVAGSAVAVWLTPGQADTYTGSGWFEARKQ